MYNGCVGAVGSPKETDARCEAPLQTHSPSTPEGRSVFHTTGQDQQKDDPAAGADVREEVLEERVKFIHAAIIQEGRRVVIRNPQGRASASGVGMFGAECCRLLRSRVTSDE